ncbi:MAG: protein kinase [Gammaproteobacteria bacterium]
MTDDLSPKQWALVQSIFLTLEGLPPQEQEAVLVLESRGDKQVEQTVRELLRAEQQQNAEDLISECFEVDEPDDNPDHFIGQTIDGYRITELVGKGGTGFVFRAERRTEGVDQVVAIKVLRNTFLNWPMQQRFKREAKMLARLNHPNIARFLTIDRFEGRPYFTMEFIDGQRIDNYCTEQRLDIPARLKLFRKVLDAVAFSQRYLIIHRDLKPENILVTRDGVVKILDFGIGKFVTDEGQAGDSLTVAVGPMLSMDVAAPEQWTGKDTTTATDVYALAVVLFKLLSDVLPYEKESVKKMGTTGKWPLVPPSMLSVLSTKGDLQLAAENRGVPVRSLRQLLRGDLQAIVSTAMAFTPDKRYGSAAQFGLDIDNFLNDRPLNTRTSSRFYILRKFLARNKLVVSLVAATAILVSALLLQVYFEAVRDRAQAVEIARERDKAVASSGLLRDVFSSADPALEGANSVTVREALVFNAPRLLGEQKDAPEVQIALASTVGGILYDIGAYSDAENFLRQVVEIAGRLQIKSGEISTEQRAAIEAQIQLIGVYKATDRNELARAIANDVESKIDPQFGPNSVQRLNFLNALSGILPEVQSPDDRALLATNRAYQMAKDHPTLPGLARANAINNYALAKRRDVPLPQTLELLEEARRIALAEVPKTHPTYANITANLAAGYLTLKDKKTARRLYEEVAATISQQGVPPNLGMVSSAYGLGALEMSEGNFVLAQQQLSNALRVQERFSSNEDYSALAIRFARASCLEMNQQLDEARTEYSVVANTMARRYPADPQLAKFYSRLSALELDLEQREAAAKNLVTAQRYLDASSKPDALTMTFMEAIDVRFGQGDLALEERRARLLKLFEQASSQAGPYAIPNMKIRRWMDEL